MKQTLTLMCAKCHRVYRSEKVDCPVCHYKKALKIDFGVDWTESDPKTKDKD